MRSLLRGAHMDRLSPKQRSALMARVRGKNTRPEMIVRRMAHKMKFRFRLHRSDLPGKPDLVFPGRRKVIFVHGCFWHRHSCPDGRSTPATRTKYWNAKFARNKARDVKSRKALRKQGWDVLVIWECQTRRPEWLRGRLSKFLRV
jgi:DNA mismatch endonuclease (patch repair protein)